MSRGKRHRKIRAQHKWEKRLRQRILLYFKAIDRLPQGCCMGPIEWEADWAKWHFELVMAWKPFPATCHVGERLHADGSCEYGEEKKQ